MTIIYNNQITDVQALCQKKNSPLKYYKIIDYEKRKKEIIVHCIYIDRRQNSEVIANLIGDKWVQVRVNKLVEKAGLYWPLYL